MVADMNERGARSVAERLRQAIALLDIEALPTGSGRCPLCPANQAANTWWMVALR